MGRYLRSRTGARALKKAEFFLAVATGREYRGGYQKIEKKLKG